MTNQYNFNDRASYKAASAQWKADYAALSQKIRDTRKESRRTESEAAKNPTSANYSAHSKAWVEWRNNKASARKMIDVRHAMKKEAQRQYKAEHEKATV